MIRARIVVEGMVQRVGYRDVIENVARKLGVKGYVENLKDGNVQIICEAEERILEDFVKEIDVKEDFIEVERVQIVEKSKATGEFSYFEIKYGRLEEEFGERIGTAIKYAGAIRQDVKDMHKDLKENTTGIKDAIGEMHKDLRDEIVGVRGEVRDMHVDMSKSFEEMAKRYDAISSELIRTREELTRAVDGLLKMIEEFIHERRRLEGARKE